MSVVVDSEYRITPDTQGACSWYCLRTHNKHESIAAAHLKQQLGLEVFLPRVRLKRTIRLQAVWITEPLFPNYLFAQFDLGLHLRAVQHSRGVRDVVHFGPHWAAMPDQTVDELRQAIGPGELHVVADDPQIGEEVLVAAGPLRGLTAVVLRQLNGAQRVAVMLEFLGQQTVAEVGADDLIIQRLRWCAA